MYVHARAPVRIGIAGGGTDLPAWTRDRQGACISLAINSYTHAVAIPRSDRQVVASYRQLDTAWAATEIANGIIREAALLHGWEDGFEVHTLSDVSSRGSGLGVSSSIAVCLSAVFERMRQIRAGESSEIDFGKTARAAWTVEIDRLRRPIGRQDHMAATWGGLRRYAFEGDQAKVAHTFSDEDAAWAANHLRLIPLSSGHDSRTILSNAKTSAQLDVAYRAVAIAEEAIRDRDVSKLGQALALGQSSKRQIAGAVTAEVVQVVEALGAIEAVAGCKVTGAGGGGHVVVAVYDGYEVDAAIRQIGYKAICVRPAKQVRVESWED